MVKTILILAANPKDTSRLRLDQEVREIDNGLQRARRRDEFSLKQVWAVRRSDFRRAMLDAKPRIVHFCGHGSGEEGIAFEDDSGQAKLIGTEALSGFFELFADTVECVVLNACYSEVQAEAIAKYIPHVIGMKRAIGDTAAIEFAVAFYDALGAGETVEFAYKLACNAIQLSGLPDHHVPSLRSRPGLLEGNRQGIADTGIRFHTGNSIIESPYYGPDTTILKFTLTNLAGVPIKLTFMRLMVIKRERNRVVRLARSGAPKQEFRLVADIRSSNSIELLDELGVVFVLENQETEAFDLRVIGQQGISYTGIPNMEFLRCRGESW